MTGEQIISVGANTESMDTEISANIGSMDVNIGANTESTEVISQFIMGVEGIFDDTFDLTFN